MRGDLAAVLDRGDVAGGIGIVARPGPRSSAQVATMPKITAPAKPLLVRDDDAAAVVKAAEAAEKAAAAAAAAALDEPEETKRPLKKVVARVAISAAVAAIALVVGAPTRNIF